MKTLLIPVLLLGFNYTNCTEQKQSMSIQQLSEQYKVQVSSFTNDKIISEINNIINNNIKIIDTKNETIITKFSDKKCAAFNKALLKQIILKSNKIITKDDVTLFDSTISSLDNENKLKASLLINQMLQISREQNNTNARILFSTLDAFNIYQLWCTLVVYQITLLQMRYSYLSFGNISMLQKNHLRKMQKKH